jgi:3D (Asp-Asp-Asp) domain-containing protein
MKDLKLTTLALTTTVLIASNLIISKQYTDDTKRYETKIHNQYELIKQNEVDIKKKVLEVRNNQVQINDLNNQLDQLKKQNDELKKQLESEREARKKYFIITFYTNGYESTQKKYGDKGYGITASGTRATEGRTIAAPKSIPFGTKVYIQGIGYRIVEDRGNSITNNHIDVYVENVNMAKELGKQTLLVEILD